MEEPLNQNKMKQTANKKSAGRPKKPASTKKKIYESPRQVDWQYAYDIIAAKNEAIADLETKLDEAYVEQEQMIEEIDKWIFQVIHHCAEVESNTGKITLNDVDYCVDLIRRIMKYKFVD